MKKKVNTQTREMRKRINLNDIAKLAGLSRSTVGHILNGKAEALKISKDSEQKVLKIASEHGYLKNRAVRQLHANKTFQVAFITTSEPGEIPGIPPEIVHMLGALQKENYHMILINVNMSTQEISEAFQERAFDGMVIYGTVPNRDFFVEWGEKYGIPHVFLHHDTDKINNVTIDEERTFDETVENLCQMGYRKIAFYFPRKVEANPLFPEGYVCPKELAFRKAVKARRLKIYPNSVEQRKGNLNQAEFLMKGLSDPPECVIAFAQWQALKFARYIYTNGGSVPRDVGLLSCNITQSNHVTLPSVCGIDYDFHEMGKNLSDMILKRIKTGKSYREKLSPGKLTMEIEGVRLESLDYFKH